MVFPSLSLTASKISGVATNVLREDYIDTELAKLHQSKRNGHAGFDPRNDLHDGDVQGPAHPDGRQPASLGRIHEIDLGPDSAARNVALTEAAHQRRQLLRQGIDPDAEKPRLRRDGKPFRRRRRNSDDVRRDKLVEEVLKETQMQVYEKKAETHRGGQPSQVTGESETADQIAADTRGEPRYASSSAPSEDEEGADDLLAEQFRRDFMEQVNARRRQRQPVPGSARAKAREQNAAADNVTKGPKLGGSRSARAKVRERQLEEAAAAKKR